MSRKAAGRKHTSVSTAKALGAYKGHWFSFYHRWAYLYFLRAHWLNVDLINVYFAISSRSMSSKVYKVRPISCSAQKHSISCRCLLQITKLEKTVTVISKIYITEYNAYTCTFIVPQWRLTDRIKWESRSIKSTLYIQQAKYEWLGVVLSVWLEHGVDNWKWISKETNEETYNYMHIYLYELRVMRDTNIQFLTYEEWS